MAFKSLYLKLLERCEHPSARQRRPRPVPGAAPAAALDAESPVEVLCAPSSPSWGRGGHKGQLGKRTFQTGWGDGGAGSGSASSRLARLSAHLCSRALEQIKNKNVYLCISPPVTLKQGLEAALPLLKETIGWDQSLQWLLYQNPHGGRGSLRNSLLCEEVSCSFYQRLWRFSQDSEVLSCAEALPQPWSSQMSQGCAVRVSVVVPCSSARRGCVCCICWEWAQCVIHPWNIFFSVCAQNKGLAHNYTLLPGKSLADIDVWKTERASRIADVARKNKALKAICPRRMTRVRWLPHVFTDTVHKDTNLGFGVQAPLPQTPAWLQHHVLSIISKGNTLLLRQNCK